MTTQGLSAAAAADNAGAGAGLPAVTRRTAGPPVHVNEIAASITATLDAVTSQVVTAQSWAEAVHYPAAIHTAVRSDQRRNPAARHAAARTLSMHARTVVDPQLRRQLLSAAGRHHTAAVSLDMLHELVRPSESALCAEFEPGTGPALGTDDAPPPGPVGVEPKERACLLIAAPRAPQPTATTPCCGVSPSRAPD